MFRSLYWPLMLVLLMLGCGEEGYPPQWMDSEYIPIPRDAGAGMPLPAEEDQPTVPVNAHRTAAENRRVTVRWRGGEDHYFAQPAGSPVHRHTYSQDSRMPGTLETFHVWMLCMSAIVEDSATPYQHTTLRTVMDIPNNGEQELEATFNIPAGHATQECLWGIVGTCEPNTDPFEYTEGGAPVLPHYGEDTCWQSLTEVRTTTYIERGDHSFQLGDGDLMESPVLIRHRRPIAHHIVFPPTE